MSKKNRKKTGAKRDGVKQVWLMAAVFAACLLVSFIFANALIGNRAGTDTSGNNATAGQSGAAPDGAGASLITEPVVDLDSSLSYYADIDIEGYGTVTVKLDQEAAPVTVSNFVKLAQDGFYDGLTFHRIIEGFMMQGGDPNGNGTGGSEQDIVGEFSSNGYENSLSHTRGAISMARSSEYNSASSQFFIVQEDSSASLDGEYAVFGYVEEGMDVVDAVCEAAKPTDNNGTIALENQPVISSITIRTEQA